MPRLNRRIAKFLAVYLAIVTLLCLVNFGEPGESAMTDLAFALNLKKRISYEVRETHTPLFGTEYVDITTHWKTVPNIPVLFVYLLVGTAIALGLSYTSESRNGPPTGSGRRPCESQTPPPPVEAGATDGGTADSKPTTVDAKENKDGQNGRRKLPVRTVIGAVLLVAFGFLGGFVAGGTVASNWAREDHQLELARFAYEMCNALADERFVEEARAAADKVEKNEISTPSGLESGLVMWYAIHSSKDGEAQQKQLQKIAKSGWSVWLMEAARHAAKQSTKN